LKKEALQFEEETKAWKEVLNTLGSEFQSCVHQHEQDRVSDRFSEPCGSIFESR
jgi:hypothetical protein